MMKLDRIANKSRRLRKKLYLGEFAVKGFPVKFDLACDKAAQAEQFLDDIIDWATERQLCCICGISTDSGDGYIIPEARYGSPTEAQRQECANWLEQHALVSHPSVGELIDLNYGNFEGY